MIGLRLKLLLPVIVVYALLAASIHFAWGPNMLQQKRAHILERETTVLKSLNPGVIHMLLARDFAALYSTLDMQLELNQNHRWISIELINPQGKRLYPLSDNEAAVGDSAAHLTITNRLDLEGEFLGTINLRLNITSELELERQRIENLEWLTLIFFGLLMSGGALIQNILICKPLIRLTSAASRMANGDFDTNLPRPSRDEIGQLIHSFTDMRCDLRRDTQRREQAEADLRHANETLEQRVMERTQALRSVNEKLNQEIVEHQEARERLRLTATVFENTSDAIVITDGDAKIVEVNPAFCTIMGYEKHEVIGNNPKAFKSSRHDRAFYEAMWNSITTQGHWQGEIWDQRKDGKAFPKRLTINTVFGKDGVADYYVGIFSDISDIKKAAQQLEDLAYFDPLTGCPNRFSFRERLNHELTIAKRTKQKLALLFVDLDRFKDVNDTFGHQAGDLLLKQVAQRLGSCVREEDTIARMGGDEFTIIVNRVDQGRSLERIAQEIIDRIQESVIFEEHDIYIGASVGIAIYPDDGEEADILLKNADMAMYRAKQLRQGGFAYFHPDMNAAVEKRRYLEGMIRKGLTHDEFVVHYQPKVNIRSGRICAMEALVRWRQNDQALMPPDDFIPFAEETGLIMSLGNWILKTACEEAKSWVDLGHDDVRVAVNLSAIQFEKKDLLDNIRQALEETGLSPNNLELEITESAVLDNIDRALMLLTELSRMGIAISIDDFGTGYSSLYYLKRLPIQTIKIDKSFIRDIHTDTNDAAIVSAIISMARDLNMKVLAEGVETADQLTFLRGKLCTEMQGHIFSPALPLREAVSFLEGKMLSLAE